MSRKCRSHILQKILLTVQDLSKAYYQISSIILLYEFIRLSVNMKVTITCETFGIKYKDCECFPEFMNIKDYIIQYQCLCNNKNY